MKMLKNNKNDDKDRSRLGGCLEEKKRKGTFTDENWLISVDVFSDMSANIY